MPWPGRPGQQMFVCHSSGSWRPEVGGQHARAPMRALSGAADSRLLRVPTWQRDRGRPWYLPPLIKTLISLSDPALRTSSKPDHFPKAPPPNTFILGVRASVYEFCRDAKVQSVAGPLHLNAAFVCGQSSHHQWRPQRWVAGSRHVVSSLAFSSESLWGPLGRRQDSGHSAEVPSVQHGAGFPRLRPSRPLVSRPAELCPGSAPFPSRPPLSFPKRDIRSSWMEARFKSIQEAVMNILWKVSLHQVLMCVT